MLKEKERKINNLQRELLRKLYDRYGGMLMGYIVGVVKNESLAQKYLIQFFSEITPDFYHPDLSSSQTWCILYKLIKNYLSVIHTKEIESVQNTELQLEDAKSLKELSTEQREVFFSLYHGKMAIADLSVVQNSTPEAVKKTMRDTFITIRNAG